ncbi:hypothetical protein AB0907_30130 [Streptomyces sp. NPDC006975]|uniref:hypothetical protein n=1 Tax=Streptomyces sp. NPDC006975 TaxID=3154310 RepID=UPI00345697C6
MLSHVAPAATTGFRTVTPDDAGAGTTPGAPRAAVGFGNGTAVPPTPLVRRVAVIPPAATPGPSHRPATNAALPDGGRTSASSAARQPGASSAGARPERDSEQPQTAGAARTGEPRPRVRAVPTGVGLTVARRPAAPVRRLAAVRPAPGAAPAPATPEPAGPPTTASVRGTGTATPEPTGPPTTAPVQRSATAARGRSPLSAPLGGLPPTAIPQPQPQPQPAAGGEAGTGTAPGPALPVLQRRTDDASAPHGDSRTAIGGRRAAAVTPDVHDGARGTAPGAPADARDRTAPGRGASGARVRGGLGAPLSALPPSADRPAATATGPASGGASSESSPGTPSVTAPSVTDLQRAPARRDGGATPAPAPSSPAGAPAGDAPLLGPADVQRRLATPAAPPAAPVAGSLDGPVGPLVTPPQAPGSARTATPDVAAPGSGPTTVPTPAPAVGPASGPVTGARADTARPVAVTASGSAHTPAAHGVPGTAAGPATATATRAGSRGALPLTVARSAVAAASRTVPLLAGRPLTLSTRAPEGAEPRATAPSRGRPVVAARWPSTPADAPGDTTRPAEPPARREDAGRTSGRMESPVQRSTAGASAPAPAWTAGPAAHPPPLTAHQTSHVAPHPVPSTPHRTSHVAPHPAHHRSNAPAVPYVQRVAADAVPPHVPGAGPRAGGPSDGAPRLPDAVRGVPVVRPAPPGASAAGAPVAVPAHPLPVTTPQTPPLADRPPPAPVWPAPVARARVAVPGTAAPVQRDATGAAGSVRGVPAKETPARGRPRSASTGSLPSSAPAPAATGAGKAAARRPESLPPEAGLDLDDLARRLIDPVARLLRAELRRGRERTGRPYDGRR